MPVAVDTSVLRVAVCTDPAYRQDGRYVEAALRALQQYTRRRIEVVETGRAPAGPFARAVFDADWNEMVWNGSLPVMMEKLLYGEDTDVVEDRRVIDPEQILPAHGRGGEPLAGGGREAGLPGESIDLAPVLWWLILLLFIIERVVSHGKRKT